MEKLLWIVLINLVVYFKTLRYGYVSDDGDIQKKKDDPFFLKWKNRLIGRTYYRAETEHLIVLVLHTITCSLIYLALGANTITFWAAILFSLNPANTQESIWLSGKPYLFISITVLLMWKFKMYAMFFYLAMYYFTFAGIVAPLLFIGTQYWWYLLYIPLMLLIKHQMLGKDWMSGRLLVASKTLRKMDDRKLIISVKTFAYYTLFCLFPRRLGMYHTHLYTYGLTDADNKKHLKLDAWFWGGLVLMALIGYAIVTDFMGMRFGLCWFVLFISWWCNFLPMLQQPIAERYVYLANIGMMLALASAISAYPVVLAVVLTYYMTRLALHMGAYKDNITFLEYGLFHINHPTAHFGWLIKGEYEVVHERRIYKALESFYCGYLSRPTDARLNMQISKLLYMLGRVDDALHHCKIAWDNPIEGADRSEDSDLAKFRKILLDTKAKIDAQQGPQG